MGRLTLFSVVAVWAAVRFLQLKFFGWGTSSEIASYLHCAQALPNGAAPCTEYPPGAPLLFLLPLLFGGVANYAQAFAIEMACFDLAACLLVLRCAWLAGPGTWFRPFLAALLYVCITALLYPILFSHFDLAPGALVLGALYCLHARRPRSSALLLGIAGALELWPFVLVPVWLFWERRRRVFGSAVTGGLWVAAGALSASALILPRAGWAVLPSAKSYAQGLHVETTWAGVALLLERCGVAVAHLEPDPGAFLVTGRVPSLLAALSMPLMVVLALVPQAMAMARGFSQADAGRAVDDAAFGAVASVIVAGKTLSPQFILWIAPLLPLVVRGPAGSLAAVLVAGLTTAAYHHFSTVPAQPVAAHGLALLALAGRNLMLVGWYWLSVHRGAGRLSLSRSPAEQPPPKP